MESVRAQKGRIVCRRTETGGLSKSLGNSSDSNFMLLESISASDPPIEPVYMYML